MPSPTHLMSFLRHLLLATGALAALQPCLVSGQEFFRDLGTSRSSGGFGPVVPSDYSYQETSPSGLTPLRPGQELSPEEQAEEADKYNFALGPFRMSMAVGVGIEFNDNIRLSDNNRESDFIFRPVFNLDATWRMTEINTLHIGIGATYAKYFDHSDLDTDGVIISPNSELALTFMAGPVKITVRDRFGYQEDTYDVPDIRDNTGKYARYENQAGIQLDYGMNPWTTITVGYDHYNLWTTEDNFNLQDRAIDTIFVKPAFQVTPTVKLGINASYSWINFDSSERSDGGNLLVGPFVEWQISPYTNFYLEAGYQLMSFDGGSDFNNRFIEDLNLSDEDADAVRRILRDDEDASAFYVKFELNNHPSQFFEHRLLGSKTAEIGFSSDYYDIYHIEYAADWRVMQDKIQIGPTFFYEYYEASGDIGEEAHRFGAAIGIRYHFSNSITLGLDYRYIYKDSNLPNNDYYQNLAFLSLYYKF
jgi:opacity protein-like surface antigen